MSIFFRRADVRPTSEVVAALNEMGATEATHLVDLEDGDVAKLKGYFRPLEFKRFAKAVADLKVKGNLIMFHVPPPPLFFFFK